jgi:hypothetical protein
MALVYGPFQFFIHSFISPSYSYDVLSVLVAADIEIFRALLSPCLKSGYRLGRIGRYQFAGRLAESRFKNDY